MISIPGILINRTQDEYGTIEVIEEGGLCSLHFGSRPKQSSMFLHDPWRLALSYTRAMTAALLFNPQPQRALLVGLGGGSLAKFLLHHFPDCQIDVVELRKEVVNLAYDYFQLPLDNRLNVVIGDASALNRFRYPDDLLVMVA